MIAYRGVQVFTSPSLDLKMNITGYLHPNYSESLAEFGKPRELVRSGSWILENPIPGFPDHDAIGCYPLFTCKDWSQLHRDLEHIGEELVTLAVVTDPFGEYDEDYLCKCFKDIIFPFKKHFVVDLGLPKDTFVSKHHCSNSRKALKNVEVESCPNAKIFLDEWTDLYAVLIKRHRIKGIKAFSRNSFAKQLRVPGLVAFRALHANETVGMLLWYVQGEVAYYHLGAYTDKGYALGASFALFWFAIEHFAEANLKWLNLGGGTGVRGNGSDGLNRFKRGWATETRVVYFCGRIFDHTRYSYITSSKGISYTDFFPAYRKGLLW